MYMFMLWMHLVGTVAVVVIDKEHVYSWWPDVTRLGIILYYHKNRREKFCFLEKCFGNFMRRAENRARPEGLRPVILPFGPASFTSCKPTGISVISFLVADTRLYTLPCRSVRPSVRPSVTNISKLAIGL